MPTERPCPRTRPPEEGTFLGLPLCEDLTQLSGGAAILGAPVATPYPRFGLFSAGTAAALRVAMAPYSKGLGHHDFELHGSLLEDRFGPVVDAGDLVLSETDFAANRDAIAAGVAHILDAGAAPVLIGGDDSVPIPALQAFEARGPLTILQVDAHIDWRDEVDGERYGLSSNMRRASEMPWVERIVQVGMRASGSARRTEYREALDWGVQFVTARQVYREGLDVVLDLIPAGADVYVAFDCDALDSSIMPAVLSPTPGGLTYWDLVDMLQGVAVKAHLRGFNLVEFAPERDPDGRAALTAGRLVLHAAAASARRPG